MRYSIMTKKAGRKRMFTRKDAFNHDCIPSPVPVQKQNLEENAAAQELGAQRDEPIALAPTQSMVPVVKQGGTLLCRKCASIDFKKFFDSSYECDYTVALNLSSRKEIVIQGFCESCHFFDALSQLTENRSKNSSYEVRYYRNRSPGSFRGFVIQHSKASRLHPWDQDYIAVPLLNVQQNLEEIGTPVEIKSIAGSPFDTIRRWISKCETKHSDTCGRRIKEAAFPEGLKLIDCTRRVVIIARPDMLYISLSYVWGPDQSYPQRTFADGRLPDLIPRVIEDAIEATLRIGYRYLWVDKYCIDQTNSLEKHIQIRQMDLIYQRAFVTIAAVAGHDSWYGLPGVGLRSRQSAPTTCLNGLRLIAIPARPQTALEQSVWMKRGWTFQEALFTTRRLMFTDQQVLFECDNVSASEFTPDQWDISYEKIFRRLPYQPQIPWDIAKLLSEYSGRELSFPTDAVKAFEGVFNRFRTRNFSVDHHFGVPIMPPIVGGNWGQPIEAPDRTKSDSLLAGLCWKHCKQGQRRIEFPSWSWAGWTCKLSPYSWENILCHGLGLESKHYPKVWIEDHDEKLIKFEDLSEEDRTLQSIGKILHIEAWSTPLRLHRGLTLKDEYKFAALDDGEIYAVFEDLNTVTAIPAYFIQEHEGDTSTEPSLYVELNSRKLRGMLLSNVARKGVGLIIIENMGPFYQRIGHLASYLENHITISTIDGQEIEPVHEEFEKLSIFRDCEWLSIRLA